MLQGRTALVTGSATGIGLAVAQVLAKSGAALVLNGLFPASHEAVKAALGAVPGSRYVQADISKPQSAKELVESAAKTSGKVDILVNSAGIQFISPVAQFPEDKWNEILQVNLTATFLTTKYVLPYMLKQGWGRIVNIASVHGLVASVNKSAYVASKHGVVGFTKATALEYADRGITCNALCPGWVMTDLIKKQIELKAQEHKCSFKQASQKLISEKHPSKAAAQPEDIGRYVAFLCGEGSEQINGASLNIDGGWVAQ